jgi:hypothetical protein
LNSTESSEQNPSMSPMAWALHQAHTCTRRAAEPRTFPCDDNFTDRLEKRQRSHQARHSGNVWGHGGSRWPHPRLTQLSLIPFTRIAARRSFEREGVACAAHARPDLQLFFTLFFLSTRPTVCCTGRGAQPPCMPPSTCIPSGLAAPASLAAHTRVV